MRVGLATGETLKLSLPDQLHKWKELEADPEFQARIRCLSLLVGGQLLTLAAPRAFRRVSYAVAISMTPGPNVAPASIRASYVADAVEASLTVYLGKHPVSRFDLRHSGKLRFRPPG